MAMRGSKSAAAFEAGGVTAVEEFKGRTFFM